MTEQDRRVARFSIGIVMRVKDLASALSKLPEDSMVVRMMNDPASMTYSLLIRSKVFPVVDEGRMIPEIMAHFRRESNGTVTCTVEYPPDFLEELEGL